MIIVQILDLATDGFQPFIAAVRHAMEPGCEVLPIAALFSRAHFQSHIRAIASGQFVN